MDSIKNAKIQRFYIKGLYREERELEKMGETI
jgi:hypothetical protein